MIDDRPVVLVTGASGFIGRHLIPALESGGWTVRRALRFTTGAENEVLIDTIGSETSWERSLVGVDSVVHLAARVHHPYEEHARELYQEINVEGTLRLARSAADAGVRRFVFISTILVNGRSTDGRGPINEDDELTPRGLYGVSKAVAETRLRKLSQNSGMQITVIRPPLVYGAGAKGNFQLLTRVVQRGIPLPFASINNRRAFVAVENLASFIQQRLSDANEGYEVFLVADDEQVSTPEFVRRLAKAAGASSHLFPMPISALSALLKIGGRREVHDSLIGSLELDLSKVASTGWRPIVTLDEGLRLATKHSR